MFNLNLWLWSVVPVPAFMLRRNGFYVMGESIEGRAQMFREMGWTDAADVYSKLATACLQTAENITRTIILRYITLFIWLLGLVIAYVNLYREIKAHSKTRQENIDLRGETSDLREQIIALYAENIDLFSKMIEMGKENLDMGSKIIDLRNGNIDLRNGNLDLRNENLDLRLRFVHLRTQNIPMLEHPCDRS